MNMWEQLVQGGFIQGDPKYYSSGDATEEEYVNALSSAWDAILQSGDEAAKRKFWSDLVAAGAIKGDASYYSSGKAAESEFQNAFNVAAAALDSNPATAAPKPGTQVVGGNVLPTGMRLVKVTAAAGTDTGVSYYAVGTVFGVDIAYQIGDQERLDTLFGGTGAFGNVSTMSQTQFDNANILPVGDVDEVLGSTESLQAQYERDMRAAGLESPPEWMQNDPTAMATFVTGANEGWTAERTWLAMSKLDSFKQRFSGLDTVMAQLGTSMYSQGIAEYQARESAIRNDLLKYRGPNTNVSTDYVSSLIGSGWQASEVGELLELEAEVKTNTAALENINGMLVYAGYQPLTADDFVDYLRAEKNADNPDFTPSAVFEAVNDALRQTALANAGLEVSDPLAAELGTGVSFSVESPTAFNDQAQMVAGIVAANADALDIGSYGLTRDNVLRFFLGEANDPEVGRKLDKLARERGIASQGFGSSTSYIDPEGRLRVQGL